MTIIMTRALLFLVFLSVTGVSLSVATDNNTTDEITEVSDVGPKPRADFKNAVLQGDVAIQKTLGRNAVGCTARGCKWPKRGRFVTVPYIISSGYTQEEQNIIMNGLRSISRETCIRFVRRRQSHRDYIYFVSQPQYGCQSYLGRQDGGQYINLEKNGCLYHGTVQHEVLHALGFHHEQVRSDRDQYVEILFQNIKRGQEYNFYKQDTNNLGTPYDFRSVMHYGKYGFTSNGQPTIVAKANCYFDWGRADQMSANDIARVNRLYKCGAIRTRKTNYL